MAAVARIESHEPFGLSSEPLTRAAPRLVTLPAGTKTYPVTRCEEISCRRPMQMTTDTKTFCCPACRRRHHTRREQRSRLAYDALMDFTDRKKRGAGMTALSRLALDWKSEDAAQLAAAEARWPLAAVSK